MIERARVGGSCRGNARYASGGVASAAANACATGVSAARIAALCGFLTNGAEIAGASVNATTPRRSRIERNVARFAWCAGVGAGVGVGSVVGILFFLRRDSHQVLHAQRRRRFRRVCGLAHAFVDELPCAH